MKEDFEFQDLEDEEYDDLEEEEFDEEPEQEDDEEGDFEDLHKEEELDELSKEFVLALIDKIMQIMAS